MRSAPFDFDDNFASAASMAALYRSIDWQVIPAHMPGDGPQWKRPLLTTWMEFQDDLVADAVFNRWYDPLTGDYRNHRNMGMITGSASGGVFILDLDDKPGQHAQFWWSALIATHNNNMEPETPRQITGGGGRQLLFRAPPGWRPPTFKTTLGVDVRGQRGFAMLPLSAHASGRIYDWEPGFAPWQVDVLDAPDWLIEAIEALREEYGGQPQADHDRPPSDGPQKNAFGLDTDGREEKLRSMAWGSVVDLYRESPIPPSQATVQAEIERLWTRYEQTTKSRLSGPENEHLSNAARLEKEGRGLSELRRKYAYALKQWDKKVKAAAAQPRPNPWQGDSGPQDSGPRETPPPGDEEDDATAKPDEPDIEEPDDDMQLVTPFHGHAPERRWLVPQWVVEGSVNSLYGGSGTGKSLVVLQLAASVSLGALWLGLQTQQGRVLMISCEDDSDELHRRTDDIKTAMGYALGWPFPDLHIIDRVGKENRLAVLDRGGNIAAGPFLDRLERMVVQLQPALLILDTLADVYTANEIDRGQVNYFLKTILTGLIRRQPHPLTIVLLGHPSDTGKAPGGKGYSGSGAWEAGVRSRLYLSKPEDGPPDERLLTRGKANYASAGLETALRLTWTDGMFRAERELEDADPERARLERLIGHAVQDAWDRKLPLTKQAGHRRNVYTVLVKLLSDDADPTILKQVIRQMIEDNQLVTTRKSGRSGLAVAE